MTWARGRYLKKYTCVVLYFKCILFANDSLRFKFHSAKNIKEATKWSSGPKFHEYEDYNNLKKLSNVLINLNTNPSWIDISLTFEVIKFDVPEDSRGRFDDLVKLCIKYIEKFYEQG